MSHTRHVHGLSCIQEGAGKLVCKVMGEELRYVPVSKRSTEWEVYDPSTDLEAEASHFGRSKTSRYYTSQAAAQADADDMTSYHKRPYKVRTVSGRGKAKDSSLTQTAIKGFDAGPGSRNPYLSSSSSAYAWKVGHHLKNTGRSRPRDVRMGRGYTIHANDMLFNGDTLERLK